MSGSRSMKNGKRSQDTENSAIPDADKRSEKRERDFAV